MIRRTGIVSMIGLTAYLCCGMTAPQTCKSNNSGSGNGAFVGAAVGVVAVVAVAVTVPLVIHHDHHTLKGCSFNGQHGLEVQEPDGLKNYTLSGAVPEIKSGDLVHLTGTKVKPKKGTKDDATFVVEKLTKDYGPCKIPVTLPDDPKAASVPNSAP
jgi:hypothetical protein